MIKIDKNKKRAIDFFVSKQNKYELSDIKSLKQIHHGYTNLSYILVTVDNQKFQIRLSQNNEIVNRKNEKTILNLIPNNHYIFYDNDGNAIKKWISGRNLKKSDISYQFLLNLINEINKLHSINTRNIIIMKHDYSIVLNNTNIKKKYLMLYKKTLNILENQKWVLSHNDLNFKNILINNNQLIFIDFEWSCINHPLWDIANFIRESNLSKQTIILISTIIKCSYLDLLKMVYISNCVAYDWSQKNKFTWKLLKYKFFNNIQLRRYYKLLKQFNL